MMSRYLRIMILLFVTSLLGACATLGTRVVYESPDNAVHPKKIGIIFAEVKEEYSKAIPTYKSIIVSAATEALSSNTGTEVMVLDTSPALSFATPDSSTVAELCEKNSLDALVIIHHEFVKTTYMIQFVAWDGGYDSDAQAKYVSPAGKLLLHTTFNTLRGKAYMLMPTPERTAHDSIVGVVEPIATRVARQQ